MTNEFQSLEIYCVDKVVPNTATSETFIALLQHSCYVDLIVISVATDLTLNKRNRTKRSG